MTKPRQAWGLKQGERLLKGQGFTDLYLEAPVELMRRYFRASKQTKFPSQEAKRLYTVTKRALALELRQAGYGESVVLVVLVERLAREAATLHDLEARPLDSLGQWKLHLLGVTKRVHHLLLDDFENLLFLKKYQHDELDRTTIQAWRRAVQQKAQEARKARCTTRKKNAA